MTFFCSRQRLVLGISLGICLSVLVGSLLSSRRNPNFTINEIPSLLGRSEEELDALLGPSDLTTTNFHTQRVMVKSYQRLLKDPETSKFENIEIHFDHQQKAVKILVYGRTCKKFTKETLLVKTP